jgi:hypothetical protein
MGTDEEERRCTRVESRKVIFRAFVLPSHIVARVCAEDRQYSERSTRAWINRREVEMSKFASAGIGRIFRIKVTLIEALLLLGVIGGALATHVDKANAAVCARGVYRAGCVGPNGAVGVRRSVAPAYRGRYYGVRRGAVVIRR